MNESWYTHIRRIPSMRWLCLALLVLALSASQGVNALDSPEFTKQTELGPIVLSYSDVDQLVASLRDQIANANKIRAPDNAGRMSLTVAAGEETIAVNSWSSLSDAAKLPEPGRRLIFDYSNYYAPIKSVEISLNDYQRQISVVGSEKAQVDAIYAYLRDTLSRKIWPWQGPVLRFIGGAIGYIIGTQLVLLPITARAFLSRYYAPVKLILIQALGIFILASVFIFPWEAILPGFAVYTSTENTDRIIGVAGLAIGVAALMGWLRPKLISTHLPENQSDGANDNSG